MKAPTISLAFGLILPYCLFQPDACGGLIGITGGSGVSSVLYELDPLNGTVIRQIGSTGLTNIGGMAFHPSSGDLYLHQNVLPLDAGKLYRIDSQALNSLSPSLQFLGNTHIGIDDLSFSQNGTLHGWMVFHDSTVFDDSIIEELVSLNLVSGQASLVGSSDLLTSENGLAFDRNGKLFLKGIEGVSNGSGGFNHHSEIYELDPTDASRMHVRRLFDPTTGLDIYPNDVLAFDGANQAFSISRNYDDSNLFNIIFESSFLQRIDFSTGAVTTVGGNLGLEFTALAFTNDAAAVPEPSQFTCLALTLVAGLLWRRFKQFDFQEGQTPFRISS